jgi:hypothetical protein
MPTLHWLGKDAVLDHHRQVPVRPLRDVPDLAIPGGAPEHALIEGDNLHALKALLPAYRGRVDCIYIDPPYNTGHEGWVYNDNVNSPLMRAWLRQAVGRDDLSRHDKGLCMMHPRLALMQELLADTGAIFVSIDDGELGSLLALMDEVFGAANRLTTFTWIRKKKGSHLDRHLRRMTEFVLCYAKRIGSLPPLYGEPAYAGKWQPLVKRTNRENTLAVPAGAAETTLPDGRYPAGPRGAGGTALRFAEDFQADRGRIATALRIRGRFVWTQAKLDAELAAGTRLALSRSFGLNVLRWDQQTKVKRPSTLLGAACGIGTNEDASAEVMDILAAERGTAFAFPKPVSLVRHLLRTVVQDRPEAIVLDAFAGSGTTGHAVMDLNAADGGRRRCLLMETGEDQPGAAGICLAITRERLLRVARGYRNGKGADVPGLGQSWRYLRLGEAMLDGLGA